MVLGVEGKSSALVMFNKGAVVQAVAIDATYVVASGSGASNTPQLGHSKRDWRVGPRPSTLQQSPNTQELKQKDAERKKAERAN